MVKKIALAFCALLLLAGCSSSAKKHSSGSTAEMRDFAKQAGDTVYFAYDSSMLSQEAKQTLMRQVTWLKAHADEKMVVEGHCDERGTREYNIALGERRANSVKHFLAHHGVEKARIETVSYGKERPAVVGDSEAAWSKNRRSVTVVK